jgi:hypothetical protein
MVRAFARKSEREGKDLSEKHESGWLDNSTANEVSPASLWGLDDDNTFRQSSEIAPATSEIEPQPDPLNAAAWEHEWAGESLETEASTAYKDEPDWWTQPDLAEELPADSEAASPMIQAAEIPAAAISSDNIPVGCVEESYSQAAEPEDDDETTLITAPVVEASEEPEPEDTHAEFDSVTRPEMAVEELAAIPTKEPAAEVIEPPVIPTEPQIQPLRLVQEVKRPRVLDETSVLPNEASYATVALNQEAKKRSRVLDESTVLPHEASFATVDLYRPSSRAYSPGKEFVSRTTHALQRSLPVMLLVAVCAGVIFFSLKYKSRLFDTADEKQAQHPVVVNPPVKSAFRAELPVTQAKPVAAPTAQEPVKSEIVRASTTTTPVAQPQKSPTTTTVNPTKQIAADKTERRQEPERSVAPKRKRQPEKVASDAETKPSATRSEAAAAGEDAPKANDDSKTGSSGGGERPRRVKPAGESQSNGAQPKPKVIDWP